MSRLGKNIRYILHSVNLYINNIHNYTPKYVRTVLLQKWGSLICESDVRKGHQLAEIVQERDNLCKWILSRRECQTLIECLCIE